MCRNNARSGATFGAIILLFYLKSISYEKFPYIIGGGKISNSTLNSTGFLSLLFASVVGLTGCNNLDDASTLSAGKLDLSFGVQQPASRAVITDDYLPSGAQVGVTLSGTGYDAYTNVCYTASGTGTSQSWAGSDDVLLTSSTAKLYSYYPYSSTVSSDAIPVETASQTDYLYGTPVTGISEAKASTGVTLNHALANLKITVAKGSHAGTGLCLKFPLPVRASLPVVRLMLLPLHRVIPLTPVKAHR